MLAAKEGRCLPCVHLCLILTRQGQDARVKRVLDGGLVLLGGWGCGGGSLLRGGGRRGLLHLGGGLVELRGKMSGEQATVVVPQGRQSWLADKVGSNLSCCDQAACRIGVSMLHAPSSERTQYLGHICPQSQGPHPVMMLHYECCNDVDPQITFFSSGCASTTPAEAGRARRVAAQKDAAAS